MIDEEKHLIDFFGNDYKAYRARTRVWIPFI
jgi:protein-S-isoprenylcysteine O-methyltransferase